MSIGFLRKVGIAQMMFAGLAACGGSDQLPPDASISISPNDKTFNVDTLENPDNGQCFFLEGLYQDVLVVITVRDGKGRPIGEADLTVMVDFTDNTSSFGKIIRLYEDRDGDLLADEDELVSGENAPLLRTRTREFSGTTEVILRMNLSCEYRASMTVQSEAAVGSASFAVVKNPDQQ